MAPALPPSVWRHKRVGPGIDVALCGDRSPHACFVIQSKRITCPECLTRRSSPAVLNRFKRELAARKAYFSGRAVP